VARSALDLACTFFTLDEVRRVVDLLALYKVNVRYLHLTDDQSWRAAGRTASREPAGRRRLLQRRRPAHARRLGVRPLRHHRPRGRRTRARDGVGAAASEIERS